MAFILGTDIGDVSTGADVERQEKKWRKYREYLESVRERMPRSAYKFAAARWHYDTSDPRSLHDSWVDWLVIREPASGDRHEIRSLEIEVRLLGPYHDGNATLIYRDVHAYSLDTPVEFPFPQAEAGHGDWLCDEVRLSERDYVVHEIEFRRESRWVIECKDIEWTWAPFADPRNGAEQGL